MKTVQIESKSMVYPMVLKAIHRRNIQSVKTNIQSIENCLSKETKYTECKETLNGIRSEVESYIKELSNATDSSSFAWNRDRDDIIKLKQELNHKLPVEGGVACTSVCVEYVQVHRGSPGMTQIMRGNLQCQISLENRIAELEQIQQIKTLQKAIDECNLEAMREENADIKIGLDLIKEGGEELKVESETVSNYYEEL